MMKKIFFVSNVLFSVILSIQYEVTLDNHLVHIAKVRIEPKEEIGLHYDQYPQIIFALKGGIITRLESDGSTVDVTFPTGQMIYRPAESPDKMHKSINNQSEDIEFFLIQIKNNPEKSLSEKN